MRNSKFNIFFKNRFIRLIVFIICLFSVSVMAAPKVGDMAIDFNLKEIRGEEKRYTLSDFKGNFVLFNIWASWCSGCKEEMPHFIDLQEAYKKDDFMIVATSIDRKEDASLKFLKKLERKSGKKVNFLVLIDDDKKIAKGYNPFGLPASYLLDKNGRIIKSFYGSIKGTALKDLKTQIGALLKK